MASQTDLWLERKFDQLYREHDDPWGCHAGRRSFNNRLFVEMVFDEREKYMRVLDIGCGIGGLTDQIHTKCTAEVVGIDASDVAIQKARAAYPWVRFEACNILTDSIADLGMFDLILMSEVLWYVCDDLAGVMQKIKASLMDGGTLAIHQFFPAGQRYYQEYIDGLAGFDRAMAGAWEYRRKIVSYFGTEGQVLLALFTPKEERKCQTA